MKKNNPGSDGGRFKWMGLGTQVLMKNLSYVFFLALLGVMFIFNSHYAENNLRRTTEMERKIRELKWEYMSLKSDLNHKSTRSEIGKNLKGYEDLDDQKMPQKIGVSKS